MLISNASNIVNKYRLLVILTANAGFVAAAYYVAFGLRFDFVITPEYRLVIERTLPWLLFAKLSLFAVFGLYRGWWRYVTLKDVENIVKANLLGTAVFAGIVAFTSGVERYPRSVFFIEPLLSISAIGGVRALVRIFRERWRRPDVRRVRRLALVVGAGEAGIQLVRELSSNQRLGTAVVGFVDDSPAKIGTEICGVKVRGPVSAIPELVQAHEVDEILVTIPSAQSKDLRRVIQTCTDAKIPYRILPSMGQIVTGKIIYTQMREVKVEDLLAREPVRLEVSRLKAFVGPRTTLVTGAAGSIGSELCRQIATYGGRSIVLYDRNENGLFSLHEELRQKFPHVNIQPVLGDILCEDQLTRTLDTYHPQLVLHAAACKHVPLSEVNPIEAARNNILGITTLLNALRRADVSEFVMVSTDKAVRPTSVMGVTKRIAEMLVQAQRDTKCKFVSVRFGNVLGSQGSVVPIFREQIARGGPVTVTHPEMKRFFMTVPEAAQLILQAATMGRGGEIFVLEMGEPVKIIDLARNMIQLSGYQPEEEIPIVFSGLRPGEKMCEELLNDGEELEATFFDRIKILKSMSSKLEEIDDADVHQLRHCIIAGDLARLISLFQALVPDYVPSAFIAEGLAMGGDIAAVADVRGRRDQVFGKVKAV